MPGLETLIQGQRLSPFKQRGWGAARESVSKLSQVYAMTQSPEFILKKTTADILTGKKKVSDLDPAIRKLIGISETKEGMLIKRYLEGDRSPEVLEGLGMRTTLTLKEQAAAAIAVGEKLPGMTEEQTAKAAGVYIDPDIGKITGTDIKTLGELSLAEQPYTPRDFMPWETPKEAAKRKYKGVPKETVEAYKKQFGERIKTTTGQRKYKKGDRVMYQGKEYTVAGYSATGKIQLEE